MPGAPLPPDNLHIDGGAHNVTLDTHEHEYSQTVEHPPQPITINNPPPVVIQQEVPAAGAPPPEGGEAAAEGEEPPAE